MGTARKLLTAATLAAALLAGATQVAGAAVPTKSTQERWVAYKSKALPHVGIIEGDMQAVVTAAGNESVAQVDTACGTLADDLDEAIGPVTHSPSRQVNRLLRTGLTIWQSAARSCLAGNYTSAGTQLDMGGTYVSQAADLIGEVAARYGGSSYRTA